ncbi:MAG: hypothetical protein LBH94_06265 [Deltaproteobacteria bacterium]|jgi:hypothetical protein|nr:hypothetical protein [Deltaproteobacteria bacterium]
MHRHFMPAILASGLLLCAGCGKDVVLPGEEAAVYTISCERGLDDCYAGAQALCGGSYAPVGGSSSDAGKKAAPGSFGWVDAVGQQHEGGGSGGQYSIRIRCQ